MCKVETMLVTERLLNRADELCSVMESIAGVDVRKETNRRVYVTARVMVAYALLGEGCTENVVGQMLGKNHSTINHYRNKMATFLEAPGYDAERELWGKFKEAI